MTASDVPRWCENPDCYYSRVLKVAHVGPCYDNRPPGKIKAEDTRRRLEDRLAWELRNAPEPMGL